VFFHVQDIKSCRTFALGSYNNVGYETTRFLDGRWGRQPGDYRPGSIEEDRWYEVKLEVRDALVRCFLDGELLFESCRQPHSAKPGRSSMVTLRRSEVGLSDRTNSTT